MVGRVPYTEVPPADVGDGRRLLAEFALSLAAPELGIRPPLIRWFARLQTPDLHLADLRFRDVAGEVWVAHGLRPVELVEAIAHEAHHSRWHTRTGLGGRTEREAEVMERAAQWFAREFTERHFSRRFER